MKRPDRWEIFRMNQRGKRLSEQFRTRPPVQFLNPWAQKGEVSIRSGRKKITVLIPRNWLIGEPVFHLAGKLSRRGVTVLGVEGHCLEDDRFQTLRDGWAYLPWGKEL